MVRKKKIAVRTFFNSFSNRLIHIDFQAVKSPEKGTSTVSADRRPSLRRERDSNPRWFYPSLFSRQVQSTALPSLRILFFVLFLLESLTGAPDNYRDNRSAISPNGLQKYNFSSLFMILYPNTKKCLPVTIILTCALMLKLIFWYFYNNAYKHQSI